MKGRVLNPYKVLSWISSIDFVGWRIGVLLLSRIKLRGRACDMVRPKVNSMRATLEAARIPIFQSGRVFTSTSGPRRDPRRNAWHETGRSPRRHAQPHFLARRSCDSGCRRRRARRQSPRWRRRSSRRIGG